TIENLRRRIARRERGYHLIHYVGHGLPGKLLLENDSGTATETAAEDFNALLRACPDLRLVFFAGCQTAQAHHDPSRHWPGPLSLAALGVRDSCQTVVGMQARLPCPTERLFCRFFYQGLASGRTVADALTLARAATHDDPHVGRGMLDWAVPCAFLGG